MSRSDTPQHSPRSFKEQFTVRGMVLGAIGSTITAASTLYIALKLGASPWPIFFVVLVALFILKLLGKTNINEVNVAATAMSAGATVATGIAFTVPGIYMLDPSATIDVFPLLATVVLAVILGLIITGLSRKHFIEGRRDSADTREDGEENAGLTYPIGTAAAQTLQAGDEGGHKAKVLFCSLGVGAVFAALRDAFGLIPAMLFSRSDIPGVNFGIYASPMALAVGFLIGPITALVWFIGALIGNFGIVVGATAAEWLSLDGAVAVKSSLGIGVMIGCGLGIIAKLIVPRLRKLVSPRAQRTDAGSGRDRRPLIKRLSTWAPIVSALIACLLVFLIHLGPLASVLTVLFTWVVTFMAAQSTGQAGINPMEVFALIVILCTTALTALSGQVIFLVGCFAAVACGLTGDVMNDFKAGHLLRSDPRAQWFAEAIGGLVGAFAGVGTFMLFVFAYGPGCFGEQGTFIAAQAGVVANMVGGIPNLTAFIIGLIAGVVLYCMGLPVITLGLGIYLPFYLSLTIVIGALLRVICERFIPFFKTRDNGIVLASGLLGGESIAGVIIALVAVCTGIAAL